MTTDFGWTLFLLTVLTGTAWGSAAHAGPVQENLVGLGKGNFYGCFVGTGAEVTLAGSRSESGGDWAVRAAYHVNGVMVNGFPTCVLDDLGDLAGPVGTQGRSCLEGVAALGGGMSRCLDPGVQVLPGWVGFTLCPDRLHSCIQGNLVLVGGSAPGP